MKALRALITISIPLFLVLASSPVHAQELTALWSWASENWGEIKVGPTYKTFDVDEMGRDGGLGCSGGFVEIARPSAQHDVVIRFLAPRKAFSTFQVETPFSEKNLATWVAYFNTSKENEKNVMLLENFWAIKADQIPGKNLILKFCFDLKKLGTPALRSEVVIYDLKLTYVRAERNAQGKIDFTKFSDEIRGRETPHTTGPKITIESIRLVPKAAKPE